MNNDNPNIYYTKYIELARRAGTDTYVVNDISRFGSSNSAQAAWQLYCKKHNVEFKIHQHKGTIILERTGSSENAKKGKQKKPKKEPKQESKQEPKQKIKQEVKQDSEAASPALPVSYEQLIYQAEVDTLEELKSLRRTLNIIGHEIIDMRKELYAFSQEYSENN